MADPEQFQAAQAEEEKRQSVSCRAVTNEARIDSISMCILKHHSHVLILSVIDVCAILMTPGLLKSGNK